MKKRIWCLLLAGAVIVPNLNYPQRSDGTAFPSSGKNSATGTTSGQLDKLADALVTLYHNWSDDGMVSTDEMPIKKTDLAMSYVILGMAIHSATDTYAHRAWVKEHGKWVDVKAAYEEDKTSVVSARAEAAEITCDRILRRFHEGQRDCVAPFLIKDLAVMEGMRKGRSAYCTTRNVQMRSRIVTGINWQIIVIPNSREGRNG